jgi:hypothetical protein
MHSLVLKCQFCEAGVRFEADRRYEVFIALDRSTWKTEPTADGDGYIATCGTCLKSKRTHAEHSEAVFA